MQLIPVQVLCVLRGGPGSSGFPLISIYNNDGSQIVAIHVRYSDKTGFGCDRHLYLCSGQMK